MLARAALALGLGLTLSTGAFAQDAIKIGVILPYSGPFADAANQLDAGIKLYMQQNGDEVAGKKIEIVRKDTGGPAPDVAKRLAQELVVRDGVDILAGFALTPEALGAADVATEAQKLMVVMNAATSVITEKSPYIVSTSLTIPQVNYPFGKWVYEQGVKRPTRSSPTMVRATTRKARSRRGSPRPAARSSVPTRPRSPIPTSLPSSSA